MFSNLLFSYSLRSSCVCRGTELLSEVRFQSCFWRARLTRDHVHASQARANSRHGTGGMGSWMKKEDRDPLARLRIE
jgi:hypothetical protein